MSLELVLLVPVLVLLTLFVLWAGRGGRAGLTADLAAEEAAAAAALCCEEDDAGDPDREALVRDMLASRPGLEYLCVGGLRPDAPGDDPGDPEQFVREHWLEFEGGRLTGGVGVLGVQFLCESDGAVAPLRGLFPTVTFHGQASEVVLRQPQPPDVGFESTVFPVDEDETELVFVVTSGAPLTQDVLVDYEVTAADPGLTHSVPLPLPWSGRVTMAASACNPRGCEALIRVGINEDDIFYEGTETLELSLTGLEDPLNPGNPPPANVALIDPDRTGAIGEVLDDDAPPHVFVSSNCSVTEGGTATFGVRLRDEHNRNNAPSASEVTVDFTTQDGTALAGDDYTSVTRTLTFPAGQRPPRIDVPVAILDDTATPEGEPDETFKVVLSNPNGASLGRVPYEEDCTIEDDEVRVSVADVSVTEGDPLTFRVMLDSDPTADIVLGYELKDYRNPTVTDQATRGSACGLRVDYEELNTTKTITHPHVHTVLVNLDPVRTCDDSVVEPDETFWLALWVVSGEAVVDPPHPHPHPRPEHGAVGTIEDDDVPVITVANPLSEQEPPTGDGTLTFTVNLEVGGATAVLTDAVTVRYDTAPGTATAGDDYTHSSGLLTFSCSTYPCTVTAQTVDVPLLADYLLEGDETFVLRLTDGDTTDDLPLTGVTATGRIVDDPPPRLSVSGFTPSREGTQQDFTVTLANPRSGETVTVNYEVEADTRCTTPPTPPTPVTWACEGDDYQAAAGPPTTPLSGRLTFDPGDTTKTVPVDLLADTIDELDETFRIVLSDPVTPSMNAHLDPADSTATGTITNVDPAELTANDTSAREGETLEFRVTLADAWTGQTVYVDYEVVNQRAEYCLDYREPSTSACDATKYGANDYPLKGTLTLRETPVNSRTATVDVQLLADYVPESDETLHLVLSNPRADLGSVVLADSEGVGTIEDDPPPRLSVDGFIGPEESTQSFTVRLDMPRSGETVTVDYQVQEDSPRTSTSAQQGDDYQAAAGPPATPLSGTIQFPPGETIKTVPVDLLADTISPEPDETFRIVLSDPVTPSMNAHLDPAASSATGTITNVDPARLTVSDPSKKEGETLVFTVTLEGARPGQSVRVDYEVENGSAKYCLDYEPTTGSCDPTNYGKTDYPLKGTLTLRERPLSSRTDTVSVKTLSDTRVENDETLHLVLSNVQSSRSVGLAKSIGVGTIENVNPATVRVNNAVAVVEGGALEFVISLTDDARRPAEIVEDVTVYYWSEHTDTNVTGGTASDCLAGSGPDYVSLARTPVTFEHDKTVRERTVTVQTCHDSVDEDDETMRLRLELAQGTANASLGDPFGVGTIVDAPPPALRIDDTRADEGEQLSFVVRLGTRDAAGYFRETAASQDVTVHAATEDGTAKAADGDYTARSSPLTIPKDSTSVAFTVDTLLDGEEEPPETLRVVLSEARNAQIDKAVAVGTIHPLCVDSTKNDTDNRPPTITFLDFSSVEGAHFVYYASLSRPMCRDYSISFRMESDTATCDVDVGCLSQADLRRPPRHPRNPLVPWNPFTFLGSSGWSDTLDEDDERVRVCMNWGTSMPPHYQSEPDACGYHTIIDDDDEPSLRVADAAADEGETMTFTVSLDTASGKTVTVEYRTVDGSGSATKGVDYGPCEDDFAQTTESGCTSVGKTWHPLSGSLVIAPGDTTATFTVPTATDSDADDDTFLVELRAPQSSDPNNPAPPMNARIDDGTAVGTILEGGLPELRIADVRGDEGSDMEFTVTLNEAATQEVTVHYATVARPPSIWAATEGTDYTSPGSCSITSRQDQAACTGTLPTGTWTPGGTLTFAIGDTEQTISVAIADDTEDEVDETFLVELSGPSGASLADPSAVGTINGNVDCVEIDNFDPNSPGPGLTVDSPTANEGDGVMTFTATLDPPVCEDHYIRVESQLSTSVAVLGTDFRIPTLVPKVAALKTSASVTIELIDDDIAEGEETVAVRISVWPSTADATGTIIDNDTASLSVEASSVDEGDVVNFVVRLDRPTGFDVTVGYATADGTATAGADYVAASGTATIAAGELSATVPVATVQDSIGEDDETFELRLSNPTDGVQLPDEEATTVVTIRDDDLPRVHISDASASEGGTLTFTVTLDTPRAAATKVGYSTRDSTATAGADYISPGSCSITSRQDQAACTGTTPRGTWTPGGTLTFNAGETTKTISVTALTDSDIEADERFFVDLASSTLYDLDDGTGVGTIRDINDRTLTVSDATTTEGGALSFEVGFNDPPGGRDITVQYRTVAGTATAGDDYSSTFESAAGTVTIQAGDTSATANVATVQDSLDEDAEQLELVLSGPVGATLAVDRARGVIIDDDPEPAVSVSNAEATEGDPGDDTHITFALSLSEPSGRNVTVPYSTSDIAATAGRATAGSDYVAAAPDAAATIRAGETTATVDVTLVNDDAEEDVERFLLNLWDPTNAGRGDGIGAGIIYDDDGLVQILADDAPEVHEGDGALAVFTVRLSEAAATDVTVKYSTEDGEATAGEDYTAPGSCSVPSLQDETACTGATPPGTWTPGGTLTFTAGGAVSQTVSVALVNDEDKESTETFRLKLSDPSTNARIGDDTAVATIIDDDSLPELSVSDATAAEGATASFTVSLSKSSPRDVTVDYAAIADPTAGDDAAAVPAQDYDPVSRTLNIAARSTTATITVTLPDDSLDEHDETFWLRLSNPTGATIVDGTGVGAITDDDPLPRLSIADGSAIEGGTPTADGSIEGAAAVFAVRLEPVSGRTVTVPWTTAATTNGNPATSGTDYTAASGTLTFAPGITSASIEVTTLEDTTSETDETFQVSLGQPTHATLGDAIAIGAIHDDDGLPRVFVADTEVSEDAGPATFNVTLSHTSSQPVTVDYATSDDSPADGAATAGEDYATSAGARGSLTIPAGLTAGEISVRVTDDDQAEGSEAFHITLSNPTNAAIAEGGGTATATILDDDSVTVSIANAQASEGDGTIEFAVTVDHASTSDITVDYTTFDGSATQPDDYTAAAGTLTIAANTTTATIAIALTDNTFIEEAESFLVRLSNPTGAGVATTEAIGIILDDDNLPIVAASSHLNVREDVGTVTVEITLNHASDLRATVNYRISRGSATGPNCPQLVQLGNSGTIVFEPGDTAHSITLDITANDQECGRESVTFDLRLSNPDNAVLAAVFGSFTSIRVHDLQQLPFPFVRGADALESAGTLPILFEMSYAPSSDAQVTYTVTAHTATAGVDYANVTGGTFTVPAGQSEATLNIPIIDDDDIEGTEFFTVRITSVTGGGRFETGYGGWLANGVIIDDDQVTVDVLDPVVRLAEGAGAVVVVLELDRTSSRTVKVDYATSDGTATETGDYIAVSGTATFAAGETQKRIRVPLTDDDVAEPDESFTVVLANATGAVTGLYGSTTVIIQDDDGSALPTISLADSRNSEGTGDYAKTTLTLSAPSTQTVKVTWKPLAAPWLGDRAADSSDWLLLGSPSAYTITIPANTTRMQFRLPIWDDSVPEHDEQFIVALHNPVNAILSTQHAWHTIIDNDLPVLSVGDQTVSENSTSIMFEFELHAPGVVASSVDYATAVRTSEGDEAASPGEDYTHTTGKVTFAPGVSTATITVPIISDTDDELDETFLLILSNPSLLELGDSSAVGTITDDDDGWTINDPKPWEYAGTMDFTVERDHTSTAAVTLNYRIAAAGSAVGGASCSTDGVDYETPSGSVTLQPTDTTATISITLCDDTEVEGRETLLIELTGVPGRKLTGVGTITSDD